MTQPIWCIMPILGARDYTIAAVADLLNQSVPTRILLINQGVDDDFREELEQTAEAVPDRIFLWSHVPPLPSLSATWNRALDFVWASGGDEALVVNNDVRLHRETVGTLLAQIKIQFAYFVSCVGVTEAQFDPAQSFAGIDWTQHGGPDFSCFLIDQECHEKYRFDEQFIPAYGEDCSYHRELMLAGDGARIFSINLPYLHYASGTLKSLPPKQRQQLERQINDVSRAHYLRCWGGPVNQERYIVKGDPTSARDGVTNPELQAAISRGTGDGERSSATPSSTAPC